MEFVYGIHATRNFFSAGNGTAGRLLLKSGNLGPRLREIEADARRVGCPVEYHDRPVLDAITANHQGVVLYIDEVATEVSLEQLLGNRSACNLFLVLDGITDPRNLGACIRSAATMGVAAVIAPKNNSAPLSPAAVKTACGGAELVPYFQEANIGRTLDQLKEAGFWVVGTVLEGGEPLESLDLRGDLVLVMGSEDKGLRRITREACDHLASIPMVETALGFNVSVATGISLYEIVRQRRQYIPILK